MKMRFAVLAAVALIIPVMSTAKPLDTRTSGASLSDYGGKGGAIAPKPTEEIIWVDIKGL